MAETKKPKWWVVDEITIYDNPEEAKDIVDETVIEKAKNGWETAGTTVPQNTQSNTNSESGTSVSNDWTIKVWEQNANLNYYQYWDDSNPAQQWQKGWMNPKYTGEWVSNSYIEYNPDLTVADLDPNYLYWENARQQNRQEAGYIARRNDQIASALYNEWLTSREDVANFLSQQKEWMNSTEADRENTIESIYKRLGQMQPQEEKPDLSKADTLVTDTSNTLYGKTTAEEWNPKSWIETKVDANSVLNSMEQRRSSELKNFVSTDIQSIASCVVNWMTYRDEQTWRDAQEIYPDFIAAVNAEVKKQRGQQNITAISNWESIKTTADSVDTNTQLTTFAVNNSNTTSSATQLLKSVDSILESNNTAKSAQDLMWSIENDMAKLKNRLKNLRGEANAAFKWDVPDYIVNAYMNNKSQEIQNQLSILEDRYNAAYNRYKLEVSNAQWQAEYDLKKDSFALEKWKAENGWTTTSSASSQSKMRTERNNNPTAMTTDYAKMMWLELWVDYEIWDSFIGGDGKTYYTAKFIGDPIEMSIKAFDRWAANNVFANEWWVLWHWHLWISNQQWLNMTDWEKREVINKILKKEWGNMDNMAYYTELWWNNSAWYDLTYQSAYEKYLSWNYNKAWLDSQCNAMWITAFQFGQQAQAYKTAKDNGELDIEDSVLMNWGKWVRNDWKVFDFSQSSLYKWLSERDKEAVQQLLNNNISKKYINSNRTSYDNPSGIFSAVNQIDPTWSETWYEKRLKAETKREQWTQWGWVSRNESAMATAKELYELADILDDSTVKLLGEKYNVKAIKDIANLTREQLWDPKIAYLATLVYWLQEEAAGALKWGNAANSDQDVKNMENLLSLWLSQEQLKSAVKWIARLLYLKDESEVRDLAKSTLIKPESTWGESVTDWMYDTLWMKDLPIYYDYTPKTERKREMTQEEEDALFDMQ
jgi:hypothetical protein